jgi:hypothetical protein
MAGSISPLSHKVFANDDGGLDAYAPGSLAHKATGVASSITCTLRKLKSDAKRAKENYPGLEILIFYTPLKVTALTTHKWATEVHREFGLELRIVSREDIITSLMLPFNASLCGTLPGIRGQVSPFVPLGTVRLCGWGQDTPETPDINVARAALAEPRCISMEQVLVAGAATICLLDGTKFHVPQPFAALAPLLIRTVMLPKSDRSILTVENATSFHDLASGRAGPLNSTLVLYAAGMGSPSFLDFYGSLLADANGCNVFHWGDIDPDGFRIAGRLARIARDCDVSLEPWRMRAGEFDPGLSHRSLTPTELTEILGICKVHGWQREAADLLVQQCGFEQEVLPPALP